MSTSTTDAVEEQSSRNVWLVASVASLALFTVAAGTLVPWRAALPRAGPVDLTPAFSEQYLARAGSFRALVETVVVINTSLTLLLALAIMWLSRRPRPPEKEHEHRRRYWWLWVGLVVGAVHLALRLTTLPGSVVLQRRRLAEGLSAQGWPSWTVDLALAWVISAGLWWLIVFIVIWWWRTRVRGWFIGAGLTLVGLVFTASFAYPVIVEPVFNSFTPVTDTTLRSDLADLASRAEVDVGGYLVADASRRTTTLNAYVSGFGSSRRVVLYDTLLTSTPQPEIEAVVAHELAHARNQDVLRGTTVGATALLSGLILAAPLLARRRRSYDPMAVSAFVVSVALVLSIAATPAQSGISRAFEGRADREALTLTDERGAFTQLQTRLATRALADPAPSWWFHWWFGSHPTTEQRLSYAQMEPESSP